MSAIPFNHIRVCILYYTCPARSKNNTRRQTRPLWPLSSVLVIRINLLQLKTSQPADRTDAAKNTRNRTLFAASASRGKYAQRFKRAPTYNRSHGAHGYFSIWTCTGTASGSCDSNLDRFGTPESARGLGASYSYAFNMNCFTYSADTFCHVMNLIALKPQTQTRMLVLRVI